jgi:hypothetical protein
MLYISQGTQPQRRTLSRNAPNMMSQMHAAAITPITSEENYPYGPFHGHLTGDTIQGYPPMIDPKIGTLFMPGPHTGSPIMLPLQYKAYPELARRLTVAMKNVTPAELTGIVQIVRRESADDVSRAADSLSMAAFVLSHFVNREHLLVKIATLPTFAEFEAAILGLKLRIKLRCNDDAPPSSMILKELPCSIDTDGCPPDLKPELGKIFIPTPNWWGVPQKEIDEYPELAAKLYLATQQVIQARASTNYPKFVLRSQPYDYMSRAASLSCAIYVLSEYIDPEHPLVKIATLKTFAEFKAAVNALEMYYE